MQGPATGVLCPLVPRTDIIYSNELGRKILIAVCPSLEGAAHALLIGHARFFLPTNECGQLMKVHQDLPRVQQQLGHPLTRLRTPHEIIIAL